MDARIWPLSGLRLVTPRLELRPTSEADVDELAGVISLDVEMDPEVPSFATGDDSAIHRTRLALAYWRAMGQWRADDWALLLTVRSRGDAVGVQVIEGRRFAVRRTVETASWLAAEQRGRGIGKEMRGAVLSLAFDILGAGVAETEALADNRASLGVSRALGYEPNGENVFDHDGVPETMLHLRLTRERWQDRRLNWPVEITGWESTLLLFGL